MDGFGNRDDQVDSQQRLDSINDTVRTNTKRLDGLFSLKLFPEDDLSIVNNKIGRAVQSESYCNSTFCQRHNQLLNEFDAETKSGQKGLLNTRGDERGVVSGKQDRETENSGKCDIQLKTERTCPDVLAEANRERADAFFRRLVADGKVDAYLAVVAKRATLDSVQAIADRIRTPDAGNALRSELRARSQP